MSLSFDQGIELVKVCIQIVALGGAYFAWQHFYTNREKVRLDLFEKRFVIYDTVTKTIEDCLWGDGTLERKLYSEFRSACNEAQFLLPNKAYSKVNRANELVSEFLFGHRRLARYQKSSRNETQAQEMSERLCKIEETLDKLQLEIQATFLGILKFEKF